MDALRSTDSKTTVFFDASCPICRSEIGAYEKRDRAEALHFVDISSADAPIPPGLDRAALLARFHVISGEGRLLSGAAAFAEIWRRLPGWQWAAHVAAIPAIAWLLERMYWIFLKLRPALVPLFKFYQTVMRLSTKLRLSLKA